MKPVPDFTPRPLPGGVRLTGCHCILEPFDATKHGKALGNVLAGPENAHIWTYMPMDAFPDPQSFGADFEALRVSKNWATLTIVRKQDHLPLGMASYMRQRPEHGSVEVGCVAFGTPMQRTIISSEAMYLMAAHVFDDLQYRRYEWKCHNENQASRNAAERYGFLFEGVFRNDMVMKGHNRDTAWLAMTDDDWPFVKSVFRAWLSPDNFDEQGQQRVSLTQIRKHQQLMQQQQ